jgi:hypothetical protein
MKILLGDMVERLKESKETAIMVERVENKLQGELY